MPLAPSDTPGEAPATGWPAEEGFLNVDRVLPGGGAIVRNCDRRDRIGNSVVLAYGGGVLHLAQCEISPNRRRVAPAIQNRLRPRRRVDRIWGYVRRISSRPAESFRSFSITAAGPKSGGGFWASLACASSGQRPNARHCPRGIGLDRPREEVGARRYPI